MMRRVLSETDLVSGTLSRLFGATIDPMNVAEVSLERLVDSRQKRVLRARVRTVDGASFEFAIYMPPSFDSKEVLAESQSEALLRELNSPFVVRFGGTFAIPAT